MDAFLMILLTILLFVGFLTATGIFAERIAILLRRIRPESDADMARLLLKGLLLLAAFVFALLVLHLVGVSPSRPQL